MTERRCRLRSALAAALVLLAVPLAAAPAAPAGDPGEALREAARAGDLERIESLLAAGTPVDAPARYRQTPLYFAAEKGRLEAARRLVEAGADVNVRDGFFGASPLALALWGEHFELARYLLAHGAEDAALALGAAVERSDVELARAALATGLIEPLDLAAVRRAAEDASEAFRELLAAATAEPRDRPPYRPPAERLAAYAGRYRTREGDEVTVDVRGRGLVLTLPGPGEGETERAGEPVEVAVAPVEEDRFDSAGGDLSIVFGGRAGLIEWALVNRGGELLRLGAAGGDDPAPLRTARASAGVADGAAAGPPRPWPQFRGPGASGIGDGQGAPAAWDVATGEGVRWKTAIPGIGLCCRRRPATS